jgi:hypothetical protein
MTSEQTVVPVSVVRGAPTAEEVAALVAVLVARRARSSAPVPGTGLSAWADPAARMRTVPVPGPGAWRRSGLPR